MEILFFEANLRRTWNYTCTPPLSSLRCSNFVSTVRRNCKLTSRVVRVLPTILCIRYSFLGAGGRKVPGEHGHGWMDASCSCMQFFFITGFQKSYNTNQDQTWKPKICVQHYNPFFNHCNTTRQSLLILIGLLWRKYVKMGDLSCCLVFRINIL